MESKEIRKVELTPSDTNKNLIESYNFATLRDGIGLYGQRLMLRLVEAANNFGMVDGADFKNGDCTQWPVELIKDLGGYTRIVMPKTAIMGEADEYSKVVKDIEACMCQIIKYIDDNGDVVMFPFLTKARFSQRGKVEIEVCNELWEVVLNYTKGFRKFELKTAFKFRTKYSLRLYQLVTGQKENLTYSLDDLREILGTSWTQEEQHGKKKEIVSYSSYANPGMLIKRVIEPSKQELDSCSPYSFDYELLYSNKVKPGKKTVKSIVLIPRYQPQFSDPYLHHNDLTQKYKKSMSNFMLEKEEKDILTNYFELTDKGFVNNWLLWDEVKKLEKLEVFNLLNTLDILKERASRTRPEDLPKFVIGSLQAILKGYGVDIKKIRADMRAKK